MRRLSFVFLICASACGDESPGMGGPDLGSESGSTGDPSMTEGTVGMSTSTSTSTSDAETTNGPTSGSGESGGACMPEFEPPPEEALPRCDRTTLDCWIACAGEDPHACTSACAAADPTPGYDLDDGTTLDCSRCINVLFGGCWHEACPEETEASHCCALASGCDPECLAFGPCNDEDLECLRQACPFELADEAACLERTGALESCRLQNDGPAIACFGEPR